MEGARLRRQSAAVWLVLCLLAVGAAGPVVALSPPSCNEATGIARLEGGGWAVTSWDRIVTFDEDWEDRRDRWTPSNRTYGVARGPNGSLWVLQTERVVRISESLEPNRTVRLAEPLGTDDSRPNSADLAYAGRWIVVADGDVTSYDANWSDYDPTPQMRTVVPADTRGLYATGQGVVFVTGNGTLVGARQEVDGNFTRTGNASLNVSDEAVDIHPGANSLLLVQPGNVTAYDSNLTRLDRRADVFSPAGCNWSGAGYGWGVALPVLVIVGMYVLGSVLVVTVVAGVLLVVLRYLRS